MGTDTKTRILVGFIPISAERNNRNNMNKYNKKSFEELNRLLNDLQDEEDLLQGDIGYVKAAIAEKLKEEANQLKKTALVKIAALTEEADRLLKLCEKTASDAGVDFTFRGNEFVTLEGDGGWVGPTDGLAEEPFEQSDWISSDCSADY